MSSGLSTIFRILLLTVSAGTTLFFLRKIRKAKVQIQDVIFWLLFSAALVMLSLFPGALGYFSELLGIMSPANFLFLVIIFLLMIHQFALTIRISMLEYKLNKMGREYALDNAELAEKEEEQKLS